MSKYFKNVETLEELRRQYKELLKRFHPDNPNGSTKATQEINAEYDKLFKILKDKHENNTTEGNGSESKSSFDQMKWDATEDEKLREKLASIIHLSGITIEIIGAWIWISGNTYLYRNELKRLGFKFAGQKKAWYWHSEPYQKRSHKKLSMNDIRNYYGSTEVQTEYGKLLRQA